MHFPTALKQGSRIRKADPVHLRLDPGKARILAGPARAQIDSLEGSGGNREFRWLLLVPDAKETAAKPPTITLHAADSQGGRSHPDNPSGPTKVGRGGKDQSQRMISGITIPTRCERCKLMGQEYRRKTGTTARSSRCRDGWSSLSCLRMSDRAL